MGAPPDVGSQSLSELCDCGLHQRVNPQLQLCTAEVEALLLAFGDECPVPGGAGASDFRSMSAWREGLLGFVRYTVLATTKLAAHPLISYDFAVGRVRQWRARCSGGWSG